MEGRFGEDRLTREERLGDLLGDADSPVVVSIGGVGEGDQKAGVRVSSHRREKPFRDDRFLGPRMRPASRMKGCDSSAFARSSCCRTMRPWDTPVLAATPPSHAASSFPSRIVIVLLIRPKCNTR